MSIFDTMIRRSICDVVILDDEEMVRVVTRVFLDEFGFFACEAANGTEALAILDAIPCRILLADVQLGVDSRPRDGRAVAAEAMRRHPDLAVIYASGSPVELGRPLARRERILGKPIHPGRLIDAIRDLLLSGCGTVPAERWRARSDADDAAAFPDEEVNSRSDY